MLMTPGGRAGGGSPLLRRLVLDMGVVALLCAVTAVYLPGAWWAWLTLNGLDEREILKVGGEAVLRGELTRWWLATAVGLAAMLLRSRLPLVALAGAAAMTLVHLTSQYLPLLPLDFAALIALYTVAAESPRRWVSYTALGMALAAASVPALWFGISVVPWGSGVFGPPVGVVLAWLLGDRSRARRDQATRQARELEQEGHRQAELASAAERARIARELHDAVAHGLAIVVIQAQAAAGALDKRPATARVALEAIEATGRDSLTEMRRLLGLTRSDGADLAPLPGAADLPALVDRVRATGMPVPMRVTGELADLPAGIGRSVYRITQEALTNALKHAGPAATVDIEIRCGPEAAELTVADTGRGAGSAVDERRGSGLRGMRERVEMLDGVLTLGDRPDGGFGVHAYLPAPGSP
jgi:signal transduction histidine kinase